MNKLKQEVGRRIERLLEEKGISKAKFCENIDISQQAYYKWIRGTAAPDIPHLLAISKLFNVSIDYLLKGSDENEIINFMEEKETEDYER